MHNISSPSSSASIAPPSLERSKGIKRKRSVFEEGETPSPLTNLPEDLFVHSLQFLDVVEVMKNCFTVNKRFLELSRKSIQGLRFGYAKLNEVFNKELASLAKFSLLQNLQIRPPNVTDEGLKYLTELSCLQSIDLAFNKKITTRGFSFLKCQNMRSVKLYCMTSSGGWFHQLNRLEELNLSDCHNICDDDIKKLVEARAPIKRLIFRQCNSITRKIFKYFKSFPLAELTLDKCPQLKANFSDTEDELPLMEGLRTVTSLTLLDFNSCGVTDRDIQCLRYHRLQVLSLRDCIFLTDAAFNNFKMTLRELCIEGCSKLSDQTVQVFSNPNLTRLSMSKCIGMSDYALKALAKATSLTELDISVCTKMTAEGIYCLHKLYQLKMLNLDGCRQVNYEVLKELKHLPLKRMNFEDIDWGPRLSILAKKSLIEVFQKARPSTKFLRMFGSEESFIACELEESDPWILQFQRWSWSW